VVFVEFVPSIKERSIIMGLATGENSSQPETTVSSKSESASAKDVSKQKSIKNKNNQSGQPEKPKRFEIFNKTPRRIAIHARRSKKKDEAEYLVISPFSTKVLSADAIKEYDYERWEQEDLIDVSEVIVAGDDSAALGYGVGCGVWLVIYLVVAILVPIFRASTYTWIIFVIFLLISVILTFSSTGGFKNFGSNLKRVGRGILQIINLTLFLIVVFGLGIGLLYLFSGGKDWMATREFTMEGLGRVIQYLFLTIATLLPALMYFLFNRRQREKVQENFIREVLRLDPGIRTITEAESKYLSLVQETFGTTHTSAFLFTSGLPILLCTLLILMGWLLVLQPFAGSSPVNVQELETLLLPRSNAVTFAFLGSYFFAISLVFRRYVRADLTPKTYTHIILRLLLAIILAWTLSALPVFAESNPATNAAGTILSTVTANEETAQPEPNLPSNEAGSEAQSTDASNADAGGFSTGLLYLLAFFIGIFPETGVTALQDLARNPFFMRMFPRLEEQHPLTRLDGINLYDRSRFLEEGIENIENLAHHNLISLMLNTRISTNRLVDMFDQAILYLHLGLDPEAEIAVARKQLREYGIRTATDLEAGFQAADLRGDEERKKFLMILHNENAQTEPLSRIRTILDTLRDDDWMTYLRNWRELNQQTTQIFTLKGVILVPLEDHVQKAMNMAY
jgi:hypothetical protein